MSDADAWEQCIKCGRNTCNPECTKQENPMSADTMRTVIIGLKSQNKEFLDENERLMREGRKHMTHDEIRVASASIDKMKAIRNKAELDIANQIVSGIRNRMGSDLPIGLRQRLCYAAEDLWDLERILSQAAYRKE